MKAMIQSDFITMKNSLLQLLGVCVLVAIFISIGTGTPIAGVAAVCAMVPFMYIFSITVYDEMNGWERFRLTLPLSRRQVVFGRYASCLIVVLAADVLMMILAGVLWMALSSAPLAPNDAGFWVTTSSVPPTYDPMRMGGLVLIVSATMLLATACTMPMLMRFGMTKATRLVPVIIMLLLMGGAILIGNFEESLVEMAPSLELIFGFSPEGAPLALGIGASVFAIIMVLYIVSALIAVKLYEGREF